MLRLPECQERTFVASYAQGSPEFFPIRLRRELSHSILVRASMSPITFSYYPNQYHSVARSALLARSPGASTSPRGRSIALFGMLSTKLRSSLSLTHCSIAGGKCTVRTTPRIMQNVVRGDRPDTIGQPYRRHDYFLLWTNDACLHSGPCNSRYQYIKPAIYAAFARPI